MTTFIGIVIGMFGISVMQLVLATAMPYIATEIGGEELSWPPDSSGWLLQPNAVSVAQPGGWFTVPGSAGNCVLWPTGRGGPLRMGQPNSNGL